MSIQHITIDRTCVINLTRDNVRLERFYQNLPNDWPFPKPIRFDATDGVLVPAPPWWKGGAAGWGCFRSHQRVIESALNEDVESLLVLEDDAIFVGEFSRKLEPFTTELPSDWEWIYLGGQHIQRELGLPVRISEHVYRPFNAHRAHAYALRGKRVMRMICEHLNTPEDWDWNRGTNNQIDHRLGELHVNFAGGLYCPDRWLIGQAAGHSNLKKKHLDATFFPDSRSYYETEIDYPVVAVAGSDPFQRKLVAAILHRIGIPMGNAQPAGTIAQAIDSFAAPGLGSVCDQLIKDPFWYPMNDFNFRTAHLRMWASRRSHTTGKRTIAIGATHSKLALMLEEIAVAWNRPKLIITPGSPLRKEQTANGLSVYNYRKIRNSLSRIPKHSVDGILRIDTASSENTDEWVNTIVDFVNATPSHATLTSAKYATAAAIQQWTKLSNDDNRSFRT